MPKASVKVMRSYDYCHFEVALSTDYEASLDEVNELRRQAAILVDEAVREYRIAKEKESARNGIEWQFKSAAKRAESIKLKPASEWSIEDAAFMRGYEDNEFWKAYDDESFVYTDDGGERDHHFSMLRKFKESRVRAG